ncbi:hypothetical protein CHS0354_033924 [Potamilus streckersoni]|uniref:P/Homo B domain-containing protein n=1 Tax=Potamilus streckersoni TaxID=2493646 RepID=A0AAE0VKD8_9BIVA|nr:hypothetical protein CHS0354_033924 [Potamilus streckersoni]
MLRILQDFVKVLIFVFTWDDLNSNPVTDLLTNEYVLQLDPKDLLFVEEVARKYNLTMSRKLLNNTFLFVKPDQPARFDRSNYTWKMEDFRTALGNKVTSIEQQILRKFSQPEVTKASSAIGFEDVSYQFPDVQGRFYYGMGIEEVWAMGYQGYNVTVAIVDIGVEMNHRELYPNIDMNLSHCYGDKSCDANPPKHTNYEEYQQIDHGSKCAGLVAAVKNNQFCSAGVAPRANLASIRFLDEDGKSTEARLVSALRHKDSDIDIYSSSWALPEYPFVDVGSDYQRALSEGVEKGRNYRGSIYVFPAGNYRESGNCNADGYINTIYGITISSVGFNGSKPDYIPVCSCVLASTFGEGNMMTSNLLFTAGRNSTCTVDFHMTSASVALASGIIALTLEANSLLTWRDIQHIIVKTASFKELESSGSWMINGAGKRVSPYFGFGLMNATAMVEAAKSWITVGPKVIRRIKLKFVRVVPILLTEFTEVTLSNEMDEWSGTDTNITSLEHVQVNILFGFINVSGLEIHLKSPMSVRQLSSPLMSDVSSYQSANKGLSWVFSTVHFWGEDPVGGWELLIKYKTGATFNATYVGAELILHGTCSTFHGLKKSKCKDAPDTLSALAAMTSDHSVMLSNSTPQTGGTPTISNNSPNFNLAVIIIVIAIIFIPVCIFVAVKRKSFSKACQRRVNPQSSIPETFYYQNVSVEEVLDDERLQDQSKEDGEGH